MPINVTARYMEDYRIISSKKVLIELDDQQKDQNDAALQVEVENMPGSSHQQSSSPVQHEVIELLSDEDEELEENNTVIVTVENNNYSDEEVLGFLTNNSSNEAPACEIIQHSVSSIDETAAPMCSDQVDDFSCNTYPDCYINEFETQSTLAASEICNVILPCSPLSEKPAESVAEVIELSESDLDLDQQSDNSNNPKAENDVQLNKPVKPATLNEIRKSSYDEYITYYCPECGIECGCISSWKLHTEKEHNFGSLEAINMHSIITEHGKLSRQCGDCLQKFPLNTGFAQLISHRITHLPFPKYVRCRLCPLQLVNKLSYVRHIRQSHAEVMSMLSHQYDGALEHIRITCHICQQQQNSVRDWREHLKNKHDYYSKTKSKYVNAGNAYICNVCGVYVRLYCLTIHMLSHEVSKSFSCTYCNDFQSNKLQAALAHVSYKHLRTLMDLMFKCTFCKSTFKTNERRRHHYTTVHKVQQKKCKVCNKGFDNSSTLLRHMNYANHHN